jgi:hypothetical protein
MTVQALAVSWAILGHIVLVAWFIHESSYEYSKWDVPAILSLLVWLFLGGLL